MAVLQPNAVFTYGQCTANPDGTVSISLYCGEPGEGLPGAFLVRLTVANVATIQAAVGAVAKRAALDTIVIAALKADYRPSTTIQAALDNLVGQTVTVA